MLSLLLLLVLSLLSPSLSTTPAGKPPAPCLYFSRQHDHRVLVYNTIPNPRHPPQLKLEAGTDVSSFATHPYPTGIAIAKDIIYVASYGNSTKKAKHPNQAVLLPRIDTYSLKTLQFLSTIVDDERIHECFPEDIAISGNTLLVGCGTDGYGLLKYSIYGAFLGKLAEGDCCSAVWGVTVKDKLVYFTSHCTGVNTKCSPQTQDKIFTVPIKGSPKDVKVFASIDSSNNKDGLEVGGFGDLDFGPDGNLYVTSVPNQDVLVFNSFGSYLRKLQLHKLENPVSIQFHDDKAFVSDPARGRILQVELVGDDDSSQVSFAVPGPLLNSKITYLAWSTCPNDDVLDPPYAPFSPPGRNEL